MSPRNFINSQTVLFDWQRRFPSQPIEHPVTWSQFANLQNIDRVAQVHREYLRMCDRHIRLDWIESWNELLAVGPFLGRKSPYHSIPFVLVTRYRLPYRHIIKLSELLAEAYLEFAILPDIHIIQPKLVTDLVNADNNQWNRTRHYSITWKGIDIHATS
jgi:hypothetical protein